MTSTEILTVRWKKRAAVPLKETGSREEEEAEKMVGSSLVAIRRVGRKLRAIQSHQRGLG